MTTNCETISLRRTPHILIGWELGGGLGHITRISAIAKGLLDKGYRVSLCLQDLSHAYEHVGNLPAHIYQSPVWLPRLRNTRQPVCFSDILLHRGYGSATGLFSLAQAWQTLFDSTQPDLLMFDYAPTALLAARGWDIPKVLISSGFGERDPGLPDMCLRPWQEKAEAQTRTSERRVVDVVNRVLVKRGASRIQNVSDLYRADHLFLFLVPEIDLETARSNATHLRSPKEPGNMKPAMWAQGEGRKVFAYLKQSSKLCLNMIRSISATDCSALVVCSGLTKDEAEKYQRPGLVIYTDHRDISKAFEEANVVICHAGKNTISEALLAGKPLLLLPEQLEQFHNSRCVEKSGAGIVVGNNVEQPDLTDALNRLLYDPKFTEAAMAISLKNTSVRQVNPVAKVVEICKNLLV